MTTALKVETCYQIIEYNPVLRDWIIASSTMVEQVEAERLLSTFRSQYPNANFRIAKAELTITILDEGADNDHNNP